MIDFVTSISWIGWALIMLALLTLWQLPHILRDMFSGNRGEVEPPIQPGADPPHLRGSGAAAPPDSGDGGTP